MRLFVALDIPEEIRARLAEFMTRLQRGFPDLKWVRPESLHITLKFIGESQKLDEIKSALSAIHSAPFGLSFRGCGFFQPRSPRVFWAGIEAPPELAQLADRVDEALKPLGVKANDFPYHPHLTLARVGSGSPKGDPRDRDKPTMMDLTGYLEHSPETAAMDFGKMSAREFFLYKSELSRGGSKYTKIAAFNLTTE